jgi:hypothetical protein
MKRALRWTVAGGLLLATATAPGSAARPTRAGNEHLAARDTSRLLRRLELPGSAVRIFGEPRGDGGLLKQPGSIPSGLLVDRHRLWLVREPLERVIAFVEHRPPRAGRASGTGWSSGKGIPANRSITFSFRPLAGRISLRELEVTLVALPRGSTGVRGDAQDTWILPRPPSEKLPSTVREVDVETSKAHVRVTAATKVRRIVRWFDALPIVQPGGGYHCPPDTIRRPTMSLDFRSASGALLARASVPGSFSIGACAPIQFWIGSRRQKPLSGHLYGRISRLLGTRFG